MRRHRSYLLVSFLVILSMTFILSCGAGGVKTPKYPGAEAPIGTQQTPPPKAEDQKVEGSDDSSPFMTPPAGSEEGGTVSPGDAGKSAEPAVPPTGSAQLASGDSKDTGTGEKEATEAGEEEAKEEEPVEEETATEETSEGQEGVPYRDQTPSKYYKDLEEFAFYYNNAGEGPVGKINELLQAIDLLTVNEQKYEHAKDFLSAEQKDLSRGDPLFIPDAVPEELRPLIPGEGIEGSIDDALADLFKSQVEANLRIIPIQIVGVMEYGGSKLAIGNIYGRKFQISQGQTTYRGYAGWLALGITGTYISEDLVILSLALYSYSGYGLEQVTDTVPRSFHIGIT